MDRRIFLKMSSIGLLSVVLPYSRPSFALLPLLLARFAFSAARLARVARVASRSRRTASIGAGSIRLRQAGAGIGVSSTDVRSVSAALRNNLPKPNTAAKFSRDVSKEFSKNPNIDIHDRKKIGNNLYAYLRTLKTASDIEKFIEFINHWEQGTFNTEEARNHISHCGPCTDFFREMKKDTSLVFADLNTSEAKPQTDKRVTAR